MPITAWLGISLLVIVQTWGLTNDYENAKTTIAEPLKECYRNESLRHPENRLPMTIETFIDLVRKVENFQGGTADIGVLATSMLHTFRQDGIIRSPGVLEEEGVIPYSVSGQAFFKHRLVLRYLIPSNGYRFPNESLTPHELCTLHFMLSHSIDKTQRDDEGTVCNRLSKYESKRMTRIPRDARLRRQIEEDDAKESNQSLNSEEEIQKSITNSDLLHSKTSTTNQAPVEQYPENETKQISEDDSEEEGDSKKIEKKQDGDDDDDNQENVNTVGLNTTLKPSNVVSENIVNIPDDIPKAIIKSPVDAAENGEIAKTDSEEDVKIDSSKDESGLNNTFIADAVDVMNKSAISNQSKSGKFIFDDNNYNIETNVNYPRAKKMVSSRITSTPVPRSIDVSKTVQRVAVSTTESDCPVENGVVRTPWGSVSLGTVLAGLTAGLFADDIRVQNLVIGGPRSKALSPELSTATIDNRYAATLTGDLAEVALEQGPKKSSQNIKVGAHGGWNSTVSPKWYFVTDTDTEMTDAEIRGGLDGLILANKIKEWRDTVSASRGVLKLSQLLSMYYSEDGVFEQNYRACDRKDWYSSVAQVATMRQETYLFSLVLDQQKLTSASIDDAKVKQFAESSVDRLTAYVAGIVDDLCTTSGTTTRTTATVNTAPYSNIIIVIDNNWEYQRIKTMLYYLMSKLNLNDKFGSIVTVVDGKTAAPYLNGTKFLIDIERNFTESSYRTHQSGMDIPKLLEQSLKVRMQDLLAAESTSNIAGGRSLVVLFIPYQVINLNTNDLTIASNQMSYFRDYIPDVKFLYLAPGNRDNYRNLVTDLDKDVFTYTNTNNEDEIVTQLDLIVERIKKVPLRISNPKCGYRWAAEAYGQAQFTHSVKQNGVNYHRLHPNYLFGVGSAEVRVQGTLGSSLQVCFSRTNEFPNTNNTNQVNECKQINGDTYSKTFDNPCGGYEHIIDCPPLYVSVAPVGRVQTYSCNDCRYPNDVKYTVTHLGLGCAAGVSHILSSPVLILSAISVMLMLHGFFNGR